MSLSQRLRGLKLRTRIVLGTVLALAVFVVLFDWNWLRGPVERYYSQDSGRAVRIGRLEVDAGFSLVPTVRLHDLHVENAPWASKRPFVAAREVAITFSLKSVWQRRPVISRIVLVDADVDLERSADGLRNWRLRRPDRRGPGQTRVLTIEAHRSRIRFVNHEIDLSFVAVVSPVNEPTAGLGTRISFEGSYAGAPFTAEALNDGFVSFRGSGLPFRVRGHLVSRKTRMDIDGAFTDIFDLGPIDAALRVSGPTLSQLHPFVRIRPPASRPFDFRGQLKQQDSIYRFTAVSGTVGETDIAGAATYDRSGERPRIEANLSSNHADVRDLRALIGLQPPGPGSNEQAAGDSGLFPSRDISTDKLRALDVRIAMHARKLKAASMPMLDSLRLQARLTEGALELSPVDIGVAGGHLTGSLTLDATRDPPSSSATLELRDLRLERLVPSIAEKARGAGAIGGHIKLAGQGSSLASMVGSANGSIKATMGRGSISSLADAKLGLDFGRVLFTFLRGDRDSTIHCGALSFAVRNGIGKSQALVLETDRTHVSGAGTIDLRKEQLDLKLMPEPRDPGLFTRRATIRVQGPFRSVKTALEPRAEQPAGVTPSECAAR
jgi:uncharacterized protein involved in outer membrane biogenesis